MVCGDGSGDGDGDGVGVEIAVGMFVAFFKILPDF